MQDPRTFFEQHARAQLGAQIEGALPNGVVVIFHIQGEGGGSWQVDTSGGELKIEPALPAGQGFRDCEVWCSAEDFMGILKGTVNARRAFLTGRLRVRGDVGLALRLQGALVARAS